MGSLRVTWRQVTDHVPRRDQDQGLDWTVTFVMGPAFEQLHLVVTLSLDVETLWVHLRTGYVF